MSCNKYLDCVVSPVQSKQYRTVFSHQSFCASHFYQCENTWADRAPLGTGRIQLPQHCNFLWGFAHVGRMPTAQLLSFMTSFLSLSLFTVVHGSLPM